MQQLMTNTDHVRQYILGEHAEFTLRSRKTGKHFTYQVNHAQFEGETAPRRFVRFLAAPDHYVYLGMIVLDDKGAPKLILTRASKSTKDAPVFKALDWLLFHLGRDVMPATVEFYHTGKCCRCGRTLTTPESIERGIGPICASK